MKDTTLRLKSRSQRRLKLLNNRFEPRQAPFKVQEDSELTAEQMEKHSK